MDRFVAWKRRKIRDRRLIRVGWILGTAIAIPLFWALIAGAWRVALQATLG
jgi:hypothetical protein